MIPGESTRVKLQPDADDKHDFINANYVTGHNNQDKAYIFTQGKPGVARRSLEGRVTPNTFPLNSRTFTIDRERLLAHDLAREYLDYRHDHEPT